MERAVLTIINTQGQIQNIDLESMNQASYTLGRDARQNDIVISEAIVSKTHGYLLRKYDTFFYKDLNSSNGTYVEFSGKRTLLHQSEQFVEVSEGTVLRIGSVKNPEKMVLISLSYMAEDESMEKFTVSANMITIGRTAGNDIVLEHPSVSRHHCTIEYTSQGPLIRDNKSANGILVNGQTVNGSQLLKDKDVIQILGYQLFFSSDCLYYKNRIRGIHIKVRHVDKWVGNFNKKKQILRDVNCDIKGNSFVAIIGGSGAGKTTVMNVINGFDKKFKGNVYCGNIDLVENFQHLKDMIGYVPQEDIIYENLTLRKMLHYTARLKMPDDTGQGEIEKRIDEILDMIDLKEHQNTYIRKLSGGQKKRASIAVELLADPKLFFLDEPTSGLDPGTEKNLMLSLKRLTKEQDKTVIMVTHTTQNLHLCDKILFMGPGGRLCFAGNVEQAKQFFHKEELTDIYNLLAGNAAEWQQRFQESQSKENWQEPESAPKEPIAKKRRVSARRQFVVLVKRYTELMKNDAQRLGVLLVQPLIIGLLLWIVADNEVFKIYESTKSMMFALSCSAIWIGLFDSIQEICKERSVLKREYMANLKLRVYILSKVLIQAILGLIQAIFLTGTFLLLLDADKKGIFASHFHGEILLTVWLTVLASVAMGLIISAMVKTGDKAMALAPFVLIIQLLFSGILFKLESAGEIISYCTISRWSVEALGSIARLNILDLRMQEEIPTLPHEAEVFFEATKGHLLETWGIMIGIGILFIAVSMLLLRNLSKDGR